MKIKKKRYIQFFLALVATAIIAGSLLVNSPRVQRRVSVILATELENLIGTRVGIGSVHWLLPNDIVVDSLSIDDQEGEQLITVSRLAAKVEWMPLIRRHQLSIRNVRLYHPNVHIYKTDGKGDYNYQFLIDAFTSKKEDTKEPSRLSLRINTLLIRHAHICHQVESGIKERESAFSLNDLSIDDLSAQLSLKTLSKDSTSLIVRHLSMKEQSGLHIDDLYFRFVGNRQGATLANFQLDMPHSTLQLDTIWAVYKDDFIIKGAILPSSYITPADLAPLLPSVGGITEKLHLSAALTGTPSRISIKEVDLHTHNKDFIVRADAKCKKTGESDMSLDVALHQATLTDRIWKLLAEQAPDIYSLIPEQVISIGNLTAEGNLSHDHRLTSADLHVLSDVGNVKAHMQHDHQGDYTVTLNADRLNVKQIVPTSPLTQTDIVLRTDGNIKKGSEPTPWSLNTLTGTLNASITNTWILGYEYGDISFHGDYTAGDYRASLALDDPNGRLTLDAAYLTSGKTPRYTAKLRADSLDLHAMQLIGIHEDATFSTSINADLAGTDIDHIVGKIIVDSLTMHRPTDDYLIKEIALYASDLQNKMISLKSDFMDATLRGDFTYHSLRNSILGHLHHSLPSLCHCQSHDHEFSSNDNLCLANVGVYSTSPLRELLLLPVDINGKAQFDALINDISKEFTLTASVPHIEYNENIVKGISLDCRSKEQSLDLYAGATLHNEGSPALTASLVTKASEDNIDLGAVWNSNPTGMFEGTFHTQASLQPDSHGNLTVTIEADSTSAILNHSRWELSPFHMEIAPRHILVDNLHLASGSTQHLSANGVITEQNTDTLQLSFTGIDLGYLLSLVKLEGISFDGKIDGQAEIANLYSEQPYIEAGISAQDFAFCNGPMGDADGRIHWNQQTSQLQFTVDVEETPRHTSVVEGYVDLNSNELWIDITADSLDTSFLNSLLGSFMSDVKGNASGNLTVGGPMNAIDISGALLADVSFNLIPTNTTYHFKDSLRFTPGLIRLDGIEAFDRRGQKGIVAGHVTHNKLKDFAYDLYIDVHNMLGIDLPDTGNDSFYTTIYGTGVVQVKGSPTLPLTINIQAQPEKGSVFAINLASQNEASSEAFITFTDRSSTRNVPTFATTRTTGRSQLRRRTGTEATALPNIDITAHVTPDATLKLVMNQAVDDHISATGNGDLQIGIHGDDISLFGTYTVERGFYRLSLQDVINKNFEVLSGSTVSFEGDPMAAQLDITARHTVNYVPLRDLSPDMTGNVHVNCLLRIGGSLNAPTLAFDLELPQGSEEEKAMLASYTNTTEQINQQFIYLLGLGKFYTPDMAQNIQGTTNTMESFISSTISGQINNLLAGIISNDNWNLASNLRANNMMTGESNLDGDNWNNMEIEGILEGRLLNNRLLINGSFGYRENPMYATNFIGDFDIRYLLTEKLSLKGYNKTNDRYFSKTSLTTQGLGIVYKHDFESLLPHRKRKRQTVMPTDSLTSD